MPLKVADLFNTSLNFSTAKIPSLWKIAKVTPLQKPGDKSQVPKIVHKRIYTFCEDNDLLDLKQGGFRPGHSTVSTISLFLNDIYASLNNNEVTYAVFIDAMKAFDTVNHEILLNFFKYNRYTWKC